jgi:hypothetical protein
MTVSKATLLLALASVCLLGCGKDGGSGVSDADAASLDIGPSLPDLLTEGLVPADVRAADLSKPQDGVEEELLADPPICQPGEVECKYDNKAERLCLQEDGEWGWGNVEECSEGLACLPGVGCTCEFGSCSGNDLTKCGEMVLKPCEDWSCIDKCCETKKIPPPECCVDIDDCRDCYNPQIDEHFACPDAVPEGTYPDLCIEILCLSNECVLPVVIGESPFDDGDDCTADSCDPLTGEHTHALIEVPPCIGVFCWGTTKEDAATMCFDNNLCTMDACQIGEEFAPWEGVDDPEFNPDCTEEHPDWPDCDPKPSNVYLCTNKWKSCDDMDKCTVDSCDQQSGCIHEIDWDSLDCYCDDDGDCADDELCTVEHCDTDLHVCAYPQLDCNDWDDCTVDSCVPGVGCQHVFDATLSCCGGKTSICLTNDPSECGDDDPCTTDFCDFPPGAECGYCKNVEMDCDDGDPETEEACVDGECVVL